ncbi:MAG: hypothetical protein KKB70_05950 [Proteobacteria bacterium]|nr:hypothetical protein [Pseudomonadota bacterium]
MKQSEKILLGVMAVVVLVAGYLLLFEETATKAKVEVVAGQFEAFVTTLKEKMKGNEATEAEKYRLEMLAQEAPDAPFYVSDDQFYFEIEAEQQIETNDIIYSGYLRFGDKSMAIINEMEYAAGDMLTTGGFRVVSITREYVSLEREDVNTGRVITRQIPMAEDEMQEISLRRAVQ